MTHNPHPQHPSGYHSDGHANSPWPQQQGAYPYQPDAPWSASQQGQAGDQPGQGPTGSTLNEFGEVTPRSYYSRPTGLYGDYSDKSVKPQRAGKAFWIIFIAALLFILAVNGFIFFVVMTSFF